MKYFKDVLYFFIIGGLIAYLFFQQKEATKQWENVAPSINAEGFAVTIPERMTFCNEPVPLDDRAILEKLDREMYVNVFWHSSTYMILKRANRWFPMIEKKLKQHEIPNDFKYLVCIETGLQNQISPSGAVGFWQFLKPTATDFGLTVNSEIDERYDPVKSTEAACKYLKKAYQQLGDWALVAASYNRGVSGIKRALKDQNVDSYYDLLLNEETGRYVYRILAFKLIFENLETYKLQLKKDDLYYPIPTKSIKVKKSINSLVLFADQHKCTYKALKELNPWLRGEKLTLKKGQEVNILLPK